MEERDKEEAHTRRYPITVNRNSRGGSWKSLWAWRIYPESFMNHSLQEGQLESGCCVDLIKGIVSVTNFMLEFVIRLNKIEGYSRKEGRNGFSASNSVRPAKILSATWKSTRKRTISRDRRSPGILEKFLTNMQFRNLEFQQTTAHILSRGYDPSRIR